MMGLRPWRWLSELDEDASALGWSPHIDIKEESNRYLVRADLPGVDPKDIDITLENGMLTICGERKEEIKDEKEGYRRVERFSGAFFRRFALPDTTDSDKVTAHADKGVLEIVIPKAKSNRTRKITVD
ncbi:MAG: heat-shock protein Hsp20 [Betaproteobacteria bacterium HGW-Betaproteobacteria-17]|nr:MAG: heat-shock protein Hsp20 [Betaproteobacteria bacterium HGW-Betaproteobacteria-17]